MSDFRDSDSGPPVDSDTFREWVEHTASARGVDQQELLNQLVSAFWVLDEISGVAGETNPFETGAGSIGPSDEPEFKSVDNDPRDDPAAGDESASGSNLGASESSGSDETEPGPSAPESDDAPEESTDEELAEEIRTLRESIHTQLEMVQAVGRMRRQLSDLSLDIDKQRSRQDQFTDRISDDLTRLHSRIEKLESRSDRSETANAEAMDQVAANLREDIESLEATQEEFKSWIDEEFDEIEGLFEHLFGAMNDLDERVAAVEAEVEAISEEDPDRERLSELRRNAQRVGASRAACEACDADVDISMLDEPRCPECDSEFEDIEPGSSWNPLSKSTLRTQSETPTPPDQFN